jgi:hypothetical protein
LKPDTAWRRHSIAPVRSTGWSRATAVRISPEAMRRGGKTIGWERAGRCRHRRTEQRATAPAGRLADSIFWGGTGCQSRTLPSNLAGSSRHRHNSLPGAQSHSGPQRPRPMAVSPRGAQPPKGTPSNQATEPSLRGARSRQRTDPSPRGARSRQATEPSPNGAHSRNGMRNRTGTRDSPATQPSQGMLPRQSLGLFHCAH